LSVSAVFVFLDKKITDNVETTGQILMQFYTAMYIGWFYKSNKSEHM